MQIRHHNWQIQTNKIKLPNLLHENNHTTDSNNELKRNTLCAETSLYYYSNIMWYISLKVIQVLGFPVSCESLSANSARGYIKQDIYYLFWQSFVCVFVCESLSVRLWVCGCMCLSVCIFVWYMRLIYYDIYKTFYLIRKLIWSSKNIWIYPKFWSRGVLGNLVLLSWQKYQKILSYNTFLVMMRSPNSWSGTMVHWSEEKRYRSAGWLRQVGGNYKSNTSFRVTRNTNQIRLYHRQIRSRSYQIRKIWSRHRWYQRIWTATTDNHLLQLSHRNKLLVFVKFWNKVVQSIGWQDFYGRSHNTRWDSISWLLLYGSPMEQNRSKLQAPRLWGGHF